MAKKQDDRDIKSYKLRMLKKDLPKNAVVYVYNKKTKTVDGFVTDRDGKPVPFSEPNIDLDIIVAEGSNQIEVVDGKLRVKEDVGDNYINIVEGPDFFHFSLDDSTLEKISNKQNSLTPDGTGTKYPTVDAVNIAISDIRQEIDDVVIDIEDIDVILDELQPQYHYFTSESTIPIEHGLDKYPKVTILIDDTEVTAVTNYPTLNEVVIYFSKPETGVIIIQ